MGQILPRGFKAAAERLALAVRADFELKASEPFDCLEACRRLGIPVVPLGTMTTLGAHELSVANLADSSAKFSALTVCSGTKRLIVYNSSHPPGRLANSLAHELSHIVLEHPAAPAIGLGGCRFWNPSLEAEADWQAGAILVPRDGALEWMRRDGNLERGAIHFGVSLPLFRWRVNQTGVLRQLGARSEYRRYRQIA